jgi:hypothetical protein
MLGADRIVADGRRKLQCCCLRISPYFALQALRLRLWYNSYTKMRFHFDQRKSKRLRTKSERGIGFEEAQEIFSHPYYLDQRSDLPGQYRAIGWVGARL